MGFPYSARRAEPVYCAGNITNRVKWRRPAVFAVTPHPTRLSPRLLILQMGGVEHDEPCKFKGCRRGDDDAAESPFDEKG